MYRRIFMYSHISFKISHAQFWKYSVEVFFSSTAVAEVEFECPESGYSWTTHLPRRLGASREGLVGTFTLWSLCFLKDSYLPRRL